MRIWTMEERGGNHVCLRLPDTGIVCCIEDPSAVDHYFPTPMALAQFIVDACNEKEQRESGECAVCGPKPHVHQVGITGRPCAEDYCGGWWENADWYAAHKAHVAKEVAAAWRADEGDRGR